MFEIYSKLIIKTREQHWHRSCVFVVKFELILHVFLVLIWLTLRMHLFVRNFSRKGSIRGSPGKSVKLFRTVVYWCYIKKQF